MFKYVSCLPVLYIIVKTSAEFFNKNSFLPQAIVSLFVCIIATTMAAPAPGVSYATHVIQPGAETYQSYNDLYPGIAGIGLHGAHHGLVGHTAVVHHHGYGHNGYGLAPGYGAHSLGYAHGHHYGSYPYSHGVYL